ncbi:TPA: hypothetical protein ACF25L_002313 [Escherichia coli]
MNQTYIPSCLRNLPKQKAKPRKQAIKDAKAEVIDQAIQLLREELRSGKLEGMMMPYQRGYLSAISKLEVLNINARAFPPFFRGGLAGGNCVTLFDLFKGG